LLNFFTMTEFWDKPAEKSGKVLAAFLEGLPLVLPLPPPPPPFGSWGSLTRLRGRGWGDSIPTKGKAFVVLCVYTIIPLRKNLSRHISNRCIEKLCGGGEGCIQGTYKFMGASLHPCTVVQINKNGKSGGVGLSNMIHNYSIAIRCKKQTYLYKN
jgi:hypothetical protein